MTTKTNALYPRLEYNPPKRLLCVIYKDDDLLVLSKPSGLLSVPGRDPAHHDSLEIRAKAAFPGALLVHRLDYDTSGVFLMAMNKAAQGNLGKQFERRKVQKEYIAHVWGVPKARTGRIDLPLASDWENRPRQKVCHESGKNAVTDYEVLDVFPLSSLRARNLFGRSNPEAIGNGTGLPRRNFVSPRNDEEQMIARVLLKPLTGRSHQLRVHMKAIGHPILGDPFYADGEVLAAAPRLQLHAQSLTLHHPADGRVVVFSDPAMF